MATSLLAAPATTAVVIGSSSGTASTTSQTIVGSHMFSIDGFSATKDLGVGKSIKSSTFRVGGHAWYIDCYPCGADESRAGSVSLELCRQEDHTGSRVSGCCTFTLMKSLKDGWFKKLMRYDASERVTFADDDRLPPLRSTDIIEREELESLLNDDWFHFAGHKWYILVLQCGEDDYEDEDETSVSPYIGLELFFWATDRDDEVKVRFEITLLTHAGQIISSIQDFYTFSITNVQYECKFLSTMEHVSSPLLRDGIQIRCDMAVVEGITAMQNLRRGIAGDVQQSQQVKDDVTFEVGGHLYAAHKCVLATRCTAFMAQFFGPSGKVNGDVTDHVRVDDMDPRVFEALLHFIYTDALPEVCEGEKVVMAQGLLVAADRYAMERLKLICADMLCSYLNDARTAVDMLELAVKHACHRLKEACKKFLMDNFAKAAP